MTALVLTVGICVAFAAGIAGGYQAGCLRTALDLLHPGEEFHHFGVHVTRRGSEGTNVTVNRIRKRDWRVTRKAPRRVRISAADEWERDDEHGERAFWSLVCAGFATYLWVQVATTGPGAPDFSFDVAWAVIWSLGFVYLVVRMVVALVRNNAWNEAPVAERAASR